MPEVILKTSKLVKHYKAKYALDGLDVTVNQGGIYGLVGNNGAGKTTLMRILMGLSYPNSGSVELFGESSEAGLRKARRKIGALVEAPVYYENMSIDQNLKAQAILRGCVNKKRIKELRELMGLTLKKVGNPKLSKMSTGEKQRYGLAAAMLAEPELMILDEPINGLDPSGVREMRMLLESLNKTKGITMLLSSHILGELYKLATDYIFMDAGQVIEQISAAELDRRLEAKGETDLEAYFLSLVKKWRCSNEASAV